MRTSADIQAIIDADIARRRAPTIRIGRETVLIDRPIDFRGWFEGASIVGCGFDSLLQSRLSNPKQPMIDLTGCTRATIRDLRIAGGLVTNPTNVNEAACGILMARRPNGASAGDHVVERVWFRGRFRFSCVAVIASEGCKFRDVEFSNHEGPSKTIDTLPHGGHLLYISNGDYHDWLESPIGISTMQTLWVRECKFQKSPVSGNPEDKGGAAVMIYSRHGAVVSDVHFDSINAGIYEQHAVIAIDMPHVIDPISGRSFGGQTHTVSVSRSRFESGTCDTFMTCAGGRSIAGLTVRDSQIYASDVAFDFDKGSVNTTLENLRIIRRSPGSTEKFYRTMRPFESSGGQVIRVEQFGWRD